MSFKHKSAKPSANSILIDLKKATSSREIMTPADEVVARVSDSILDKEAVESILKLLAEDNRGSWDINKFTELTGADPVIDLIYNSSFIRMASRAGLIFYLGPDKRIYRHKIKSRVSALEPRSAILTATPGDEYYLKPPWYGDLKRFVDEGVPVLLIGPPGSGKSIACERVFLERNQTLHIIACNPSMTADDFEGRVALRNEGGVVVTRFEKAELAIASERGCGVLLDEADAIPSHAAFGVFRLLDGRDMRILRLGDDGRVVRHPDFRIVGTQNTEGRGDERGLHHGRSYQDEAFLDRWENVIRVSYLPRDMEIDVLTQKTSIAEEDAEKIVDAADLLRRALEEDMILFSASMRRTLAVARNIVRGYSPQNSWDYAVINRATREDAKSILEILGRVYKRSGWKKRSRRRSK